MWVWSAGRSCLYRDRSIGVDITVGGSSVARVHVHLPESTCSIRDVCGSACVPATDAIFFMLNLARHGDHLDSSEQLAWVNNHERAKHLPCEEFFFSNTQERRAAHLCITKIEFEYDTPYAPARSLHNTREQLGKGTYSQNKTSSGSVTIRSRSVLHWG